MLRFFQKSILEKISVLCLFFLIFNSISSIAQTIDTSVYRNKIEEQCFDSFGKTKKVNHLLLLMNTSSKEINEQLYKTAEEKIDKFLSNYNTSDPKLKSVNSLKSIYKNIHAQFLIKYNISVDFKDIFTSGQYNCVTASALFALILDRLGIGYSIKEATDHVYLVVGETGNNMVFETTTPGATVLTFDQKAKERFVEYLEKNKLIKENEVEALGVDSLFNKFFFSEIPINLTHLIGLQYYNQGLDYLNKSDFVNAYKEFSKSSMLYSNEERLKYLKSACLVSLLTYVKSGREEESAYYLAKYANIRYSDFNQLLLKDIYSNISDKLLIKNQEEERYTKIFNQTFALVIDSLAQVDIKRITYYHFSKYYYLKNQFKESLKYLDKLYFMNNNDLEIQGYITYIVTNNLSNSQLNAKIIGEVDSAIAKYPFLASNERIYQLQLANLAYQVSKKYEFGEIAKGEEYLNRLKSTLKKSTLSYGSSGELLAEAFGSAAGYYVRKKQYKTAQALLNNALNYLPDSERLRERIKNIKDFMGK
ncbi:hypothetical protein NF867_02555 [Solitalea sp. MAHUQ-68]|uniref:Protein SirB1 N-terminal domain-containing protein n=1 Tax=Solitalea agri TaxID=2953739 RepID=A0A9X2F0C3_9SPHI|nr:hypothetical protein [Solitalea agri]MCO4291740.1 hypothetical protein [Solitalea agri]